MTQEKRKEECVPKEGRQSSDTMKSRERKEKNFQTKVVIRRLPSTMTEEQFLDQISPIPPNDYMYFVKADLSLGQHAFSRAYINFLNQDDIFLFKDKFDGYVFVDSRGNEYPAVVEFAPFQKIPKKRSKKRDAKCGTIEQDIDYIKFLENLRHPEEVSLPTAETYLEEIEARERELKAHNGALRITTPLIEYLKQKKLEKQKIREEKREERKRREMEKKKMRDEERRKRKAEKEREVQKDKFKDKEGSKESDDAQKREEESSSPSVVVKVLKNPERERERRQVKEKDKVYKNQGSRETMMSAGPSRIPRDKNRREWERQKPWIRDREYSERISSRTVRAKEKGRPDRHEARDSFSTKPDRPLANEGSRTGAALQEKATPSPSAKEQTPSDSESSSFSDKAKSEDPQAVKPFVSRGQSGPGGKEELCGEMDQTEDCKEDTNCEGANGETEFGDRASGKDPRTERRIKNKDRPSIEIYRPGMRRLSAQRNSPQKETAADSNTPSPTPSLSPPMSSNRRSAEPVDRGRFRKHRTTRIEGRGTTTRMEPVKRKEYVYSRSEEFCSSRKGDDDSN